MRHQPHDADRSNTGGDHCFRRYRRSGSEGTGSADVWCCRDTVFPCRSVWQDSPGSDPDGNRDFLGSGADWTFACGNRLPAK